MNYKELKERELDIAVDEKDIDFIGTFNDIIGQPRAIRALDLGTQIKGKGYNILITGISGTGRTTAIKKVLEKQKLSCEPLQDIVYVYNFTDPDYPNVLYLPKGKGIKFKQDIHQLVEDMKDIIRAKLDGQRYKKKRDALISVVEQNENYIISSFETQLHAKGFQLVQIQENDVEATDIVPVYKGEQISFDTLQDLVTKGKLDESYWNKTREEYYKLMDELKHHFLELRQARQALEKELDSLKIDMITSSIEGEVNKIATTYLYTNENISQNQKTIEEIKQRQALQNYFEDLKKDIIKSLFLFLKEKPTDSLGNPALIRYGVNVLADHTHTTELPVIFENNPTSTNLFGTIETRVDLNGDSRTNFMMIKAGSFIRASGGFIILRAEDVLKDPEVWEALKRTLETGKVEIQASGGPFNLPTATLKPNPISVDVKVIMVGNENLYDELFFRDLDFHKHFKISAEFDSVMEYSPENISRYVGFIRMISESEMLKTCTLCGIKAIITYGITLTEQRDKLSTRFSLIADLIREAHYWADKLKKEQIDQEAVQRTLEERKYLFNLPEEKITEMIVNGEVAVTLTGKEIGKVNGLAIHDRGYYSFGAPTVVSARVAPGNEGIINIEREVGLSGEIHDKWVLIIEGYLRNKYARSFPLSVYASICFEQSYCEIDGDSASSTEIYALLSAIGEIPLKQYIAVTGSVNQMGEIQSVGGITEKVEGFYHLIKTVNKPAGKNHGIIIPHQNINNLILSQEVRKAIGQGFFHIYPISSIDQGFEILTDRKAGIPTPQGEYAPNTLNNIVATNLKNMAKQVKDYSP